MKRENKKNKKDTRKKCQVGNRYMATSAIAIYFNKKVFCRISAVAMMRFRLTFKGTDLKTASIGD